MNILKYDNFIAEALKKEDNNNASEWNTMVIGMIDYDVNVFNQDSIILDPNKQKQYFESIQKKIVEILSGVLKNCEGFENSNKVIASKNVGDSMNIVKIISDFNLYEGDKNDGKATKNLCDKITSECEKLKGISGINFSVISIGKNDSDEITAAGYNKEKNEWEEVEKLKITDRKFE